MEAKEQEEKTMITKQEEIVIEYNVAEDSIMHLTDEATIRFGVPRKIEKVQDYFIRYGIIQPESAKKFLNFFRDIRNGTSFVEGVVRARLANGELVWTQLSLTAVYDKAGNAVRAVGVLKDITEQMEAELRWNNDVMHRDIMMRESLIYYEANLTANILTFGAEEFLEKMGVSKTEEYNTIVRLLCGTVVYPQDRDVICSVFSAENLQKSYADGEKRIVQEYRRLTGQGTVIWVKGTAYLTKNNRSHDLMLYFYVSNINDQKLREQSLRQRAEVDMLTGLYNKVTAELRIQEAVKADQNNCKKGAFLLIGLNGFQEVNEKKGYYFGDALLCGLGHRLRVSKGINNLLGRSGGVEFLLYLRDDSCSREALEKAESLCALTEDIQQEYGVTLSIGIALCPEHGDTFEQLHRKAGIALRECRKSGERIRFYHKGLLIKAGSIPHRAHIKKELDSGEGINEHVFRALYEAEDLDSAINDVLALVADAFGFHRGFVFEIELDGTASCVFESHSLDTPPMRAANRQMKAEKVQEYSLLFEKEDFLVFRNDEKPVAEGNPLSLWVLYCFRNEGKLRGLVGFSRLGADAGLSKERKSVLRNAVRIMGVFLTGRAVNKDLCESGLLLQSIVDGMNTCTYIIDPKTYIIKYINQNAQEVLSGAQPGRRCHEVLRGRNTPCDDCPIDRMIREETTIDRSEMYLEQFKVWARVNATLVTVPGGQTFGVFNSFDFSDQRHEREHEIELKNFTHDTSLYDALAMSTDDYIVMCDMATKQFYFPQKMVDEFKLPSQIIVDAVPIWGELIHKDDRADFFADIDAMFSGKTDSHNQEYRAKNKNGEWIWLRAKGHVERNKEGIPTLFAVVLTNLGRKSKVDHLTGLLDKYEFEMFIRAQLAQGGTKGVLLLLGLDNFRYINNIYGWDFGDNVLKESSLRLLAALPDKVQLYRLDGDKFGAFFPETDVKTVEEYYRALFQTFRQHRQFGEYRYYCTVSGGCVACDEQTTTFGTLYKHASYALDASKREGKNRLTVYDGKTMSGNERMLALIAALQESVEENCEGFTVYYQPQIEPVTHEIKSAEALLRWQNEELGMVSPAEFVPLLEQTGLIHKVGRWVLHQAVDSCRKWQEIIPEFTVSVNISFVQLQEQAFLPYLQKQIQSGNIDPGHIHLEITESCIVEGSKKLGGAIEQLRQMGFLIEMDDFGTGYSSLEILKNAPADVVKIDQAFVRDITRSKFDATFIHIIVELCHSVNIKVTLEGVETAEEYRLVQPMELDLIQGFLFGRPQPEEEFAKNYIHRTHAV